MSPAPLPPSPHSPFIDADETLRPISSGERIVALDFVRGVAVLGILFANIVAFGHTMLAYVWPPAMSGSATPSDGWMWLVQFIAVDGKFRGLFSLLFGAGLYLFIERDEARGGTGLLQIRRLLLLGLFGLAHFYLLFEGDILTLYAVSGMILLSMVHWQPHNQIKIGLLWWAILSLFMGLSVYLSSQQWENFSEAQAQIIATAGLETQVLSGPSYLTLVLYRITERTGDLSNILLLAMQETVPLGLIGMGLLRMGFFSGRLATKTLVAAGAAVTLIGGLLSAWAGFAALERGFPFWFTQYIYHGAALLPRMLMTLGYACLLVALCRAIGTLPLGQRFIAAGRMAFSNYIACSALMAIIFQGWAIGLFGQLDRITLLIPMLLGWVLMLLWSKPWLDHFAFGPLEWLWRCLTYQKRFPLRRKPPC